MPDKKEISSLRELENLNKLMMNMITCVKKQPTEDDKIKNLRIMKLVFNQRIDELINNI